MVKPDQLIKRRGKLGLIKVNADLVQVQEWVNERIDKDIKVIFYDICVCVCVLYVKHAPAYLYSI